MMSCERAREALLEADPGELESDGDSPLSRHLGRCPACRARARIVRSGTGALARGIEAWAGGAPDAPVREEALRAAREAVTAARDRADARTTGPDETAARIPARPEGSESEPSGARRWLPAILAAAAMVGLLLVADPSPPPGGWEDPGTVEAGGGAQVPVVDPGGSGTVAVFETSDPDITVVWFFDQEGS